ncbi:MAG: hypothetical protein KAJ51_05915, partial [Thermoplasmata archaeon]|nr:hypothetical protein [Thermoplasmata archaeon]
MVFLPGKVTKWVLILIVFLLISSSFVYAEDLVEHQANHKFTTLIDENELSLEREQTIEALEKDFTRQIKEMEFDQAPFDANPMPSTSRAARTDIIDEVDLGYDFGDAPSSGYALLKSNLPLIIRGSTTTTVSGGSDQDWFRIPLDTDEDNDLVDNLTITINSVSRTGGYYIHEVLLLIYGAYNQETLILRGDNYQAGQTGVTFSHAYKTDTYYFGFYNTFSASWTGDYTMTYNITVEVDAVIQESNNQIITNADPISGPIYNQSLDTDMDLFDWYYIDSPDPDNYTTNFSITLDITESAPVHFDSGVSPEIDFYTVVKLLILHEDSPGHYTGTSFEANKQHKFGLDRTIEYYDYIDYDRTFLGLYVQVIGRNRDDGSEGWRLGNDFLNGWVEYRISEISAISIIPPVLGGGKVVEKVGKTYLTYIYNVTY